MNRITSGTYIATGENGRYNLSGVTYDKNGNILTLQRNYRDGSGNSQLMDNLSYSYDSGNKLQKVTDRAHSTHKSHGFKDGANVDTEYYYDVNGNLKSDINKGINLIDYNHLGLPTRVAKIPNREEIVYVYDATGIKLEKQVVSNNARNVTQYAGDYVYDYFPKVGVTNLEFISHPEGHVKYDGGAFNYVYQYKDHLGNIRLSYTDNNKDGVITPSTEIIEESNYYPYGLKHKGYNNNISSLGNSTAQKKGFQDQILDDELGLNWNTFKYRNYDPSLARFHNIDPLAEDFSYQSPYNFSENKVVSHFELEGMEAVLAITMGSDVKYRGGIVQKANPNALHVNLQSGGVNSFVDAFKTASSSDPKGIGFVAIWGHGVPGNIWGSGSSGNTDITNSDLTALNDAIKNGEVSFAKNSVIYMGNCNAGTCNGSDPRSIAAEISKITGAIVIGGNNSVGLGASGSQIENAKSMVYWLYNPNNDSFLEFDNGVKVNSLGGSMDVIKLMNRVMNPPTSASTITPSGIAPLNVNNPTPTKSNANPTSYRKDEFGKMKPVYDIPSDNRGLN